MSCQRSLEAAFSAAWPADQWSDLTTLAAVSGGPDSVALLRALVQLRPEEAHGRIIVAHYNHRWRGEESDGDEAFVKQLARSLNLETLVGHSSSQSPTRSEESARNERYLFLQAAAQHVGARYVALGHTADDQAETILFRLLRGTGLSGLTGMPFTRQLTEAVTLVRPLLAVRREEVLGYLQYLQQLYRSDTSNSDLRFARNQLRHEVLPKLQDLAARDVVEQLLQLSHQAEELLEPVRHEARQLLDAVADVQGACVTLRLDRAFTRPRHIVREMFVELWRRQHWPRGQMTFERWDELAEAWLSGHTPQGMFPGGLRVTIDAGQIRIQGS
jgi:tRNA(Ile)-lysidine synthase